MVQPPQAQLEDPVPTILRRYVHLRSDYKVPSFRQIGLDGCKGIRRTEHRLKTIMTAVFGYSCDMRPWTVPWTLRRGFSAGRFKDSNEFDADS